MSQLHVDKSLGSEVVPSGIHRGPEFSFVDFTSQQRPKCVFVKDFAATNNPWALAGQCISRLVGWTLRFGLS